jgi:hypothetical protein
MTLNLDGSGDIKAIDYGDKWLKINRRADLRSGGGHPADARDSFREVNDAI